MQEFQPDDKINNRYHVVRKLGAGAMGSVYLCEDLVENRVKVALKVLVSENLDDQDVWAKGEYEALTRLRHPNLAKVYNFGRIGDSRDYFIVSEFIKGIDLYSATEYLNYDELIDIIVQICRALEYIHTQGYVHFDIKPDNILVTRRRTIGIKEGSKVHYDVADPASKDHSILSKPNAKLIDFGLAEKITGSFSFAIKGTLNYLAPEIVNGQTPDKRADLYSLGVTLYQVANRELPFAKESHYPVGPQPTKRSEIFEMHMKKHPEFLQTLILQLLEEDPLDRFQTAKELIYFINKHSKYYFELETEETRASYFYSPKLVGRKREMNILKEYHDRIFFPQRWRERQGDNSKGGLETAGGQAVVAAKDATSASPEDGRELPTVVLITGEMGSGKSRLLEEYLHVMKLNDMLGFAGNCYEGIQTAYHPVIEVLRQLTCRLGLDSDLCKEYRSDIEKLLPELRRKNESHGAQAPAEKKKLYFIERISQLLIDATDVAPYVLVINNVHWVDEASLELLAHFVERLEEAKQEHPRMLVILSLRPEEQSGDELVELLDKWKERSVCREVQVRPLKHAQITEFLRCMLNFPDVPEAFVEKLEEKTGGNPLFIVETLKSLQEDGVIRHSGDGWVIKAAKYDRIEIPQSMEELLGRRLERLGDTKRQLLEALSVMDKPVSPKFLQKLKRFNDVPILVELRDLEQTGIVNKQIEGGKLHFQIAQSKIREIVYSRITDDERRDYHGEVGDAFQDFYRGKEDEILEELAYHYQRSNRTDKALDLAVRAGDSLKRIYANDRACEYYLYVLDLVEDNPKYLSIWVEIHEKLGELCTIMGRYEMADRTYSALLEEHVLEQIEPCRVVNIYLQRGRVFEIQGDYDSALTCYKDSRDYVSRLDKNELVLERIHIFNSIGWVYVNMGKYEKAMTISLEALRVIQGGQEKIEHASLYNTIGSANFFKGNIREAVEYHRRSLEIKENLENLPETIISLNNLASAYLAGCDYGDAYLHLQRALATSREIGDPYGKALTLHNSATLCFAVGQREKGWEGLDESMKLCKTYSMRSLMIQNYVLRGAALRDQGDYSKAEGNYFRALSAYSKQGNRWGLCTSLIGISELHRLRGNFDEGRSLIAEASQYAEELGIRHLQAQCLLEDARFLRDSNEKKLDQATEMLQGALALSEKCENPELVGEVLYELGETFVRTRELRKATDYYRAAEEKFREVFDNLSVELRESYNRQQKERFRDWRASVVLSKKTEEKQSGESPEVEVPKTGPAVVESTRSAEALLQRVNQLMVKIGNGVALDEFMELLVDDLLQALDAEVAFWLLAEGESLSCELARSRDEGVNPEPESLLCLDVIERIMRTGSHLLLADMADNVEISSLLERSGFSLSSLAVLNITVTASRRGVIYVTNPRLSREGQQNLFLVQPFLNLIPLAYQQLTANTA